VKYDGFFVLRESITKSKKQLDAIANLSQIEKQFIATLIDTEVAVGYFIRKSNVSGATWVAYIAVKMKYCGDIAFFAKLISRRPPSRGLYANTLKHSLDPRWSLNVQGIIAYTVLREVRAYLHNEKSILEVDCILAHGPIENGERPHPFVQCGAKHVRRGVWFWPQIDNEPNSEQIAHSG
jgi:hypothetical protein